MANSIKFLLGSQTSKNLKATKAGQVYFALDSGEVDSQIYKLYYDNGTALIPVASESKYANIAKYDENDKLISTYGASLGITSGTSTDGDIISLYDSTGKLISSVTTDEDVNQQKKTNGVYPLAFGNSSSSVDLINGPINVNYDYCINAQTGELQGVRLDGGTWGVEKDPGCCFFPGTPVLLSTNGLCKSIEHIASGEIVLSYNTKSGKFYESVVQQLTINENTTDIAVVTFADGRQLKMNAYHPILTKNGFHSLTNYNNYPMLCVGDFARDAYLGWNEIVNIERYISEPIVTYSLAVKDFNEQVDDDTNDTFIANGIVVHNAVACPS